VTLTAGKGVDGQMLQEFIAERLAPYKRPQYLFVVDALPASATGKVLKHVLVPLAERLIAEGACRGGVPA
jgi:long-chain acyl-CoA synthetase